MASAMFQLSVGRQVKRRPDLQPGDLQECLDQALHEIAPFADEKRIGITADLGLCESNLYFEAGQIEQVLINILDNACKFTPKAGTIEISGYPYFLGTPQDQSSAFRPTWNGGDVIDAEPNAYRVDIRDSGAAIPAEHLRRIFEEYTSYAGGRDRSGGGWARHLQDDHRPARRTMSGRRTPNRPDVFICSSRYAGMTCGWSDTKHS